jgi:hypothetical protein
MQTTQIKARLLTAAAFLVILGVGSQRAVAQNVTPQEEPSDAQARQFTPRKIVQERPQSNAAPAPAPRYQRIDSAVWGGRKAEPAPAKNNTTPAPRPVGRTQRPTPKTHRHTEVHSPLPTPPADAGAPVTGSAESVAEVGVTFWKWRSARPTDNGIKRLWHNNVTGLDELLTPIRMSVTDPVRLGDRLQISVESPRTGNLYIINRTQYDDDSTSAPQVIFPTKRTRGGDNRVTAGRLVFMPDNDDDSPFFVLEHTGTGQNKSVGEILDVIVSDRPIPEMSNIGRLALTLPNELVNGWGKKWGEITEVGELVGGRDQTMTQAEKEAGTSSGRSLVQDDPTPQTIYHVRTKPGEPVMVTLQLLYGQPKAPQPSKGNAPTAKSK